MDHGGGGAFFLKTINKVVCFIGIRLPTKEQEQCTNGRSGRWV